MLVDTDLPADRASTSGLPPPAGAVTSSPDVTAPPAPPGQEAGPPPPAPPLDDDAPEHGATPRDPSPVGSPPTGNAEAPAAAVVQVPARPLSRVTALGLHGLRASVVRVECDVQDGLPGVKVVGLPDTAVREAAERVKSAVRRSGLPWPSDRRVVISLAPAAMRKVGAGFDLALALAVIASQTEGDGPRRKHVLEPHLLDGVAACAEVGLDGTLHPVPGLLPVAMAARDAGLQRLLVASRGASEAALAEGLEIVPAEDLHQVVDILLGRRVADAVEPPEPRTHPRRDGDLADVRGQLWARRALEVAAAGEHHLLLAGPPGCGKSMLARRLPSILPPLDESAALEVAAIHSIAGLRDPDEAVDLTPPWQAPHHGASVAGLVGGGSGVPRPGALSLAHRGVLFVDELLEAPRATLDALRGPLELGEVTLSRASGTVTYPGRVQLVGATNPCPCGHHGSTLPCRCRPDQVRTYRGRLSGPLLDRLDLHVEVEAVGEDELAGPADGETSERVAVRVARARGAAAERWTAMGRAGATNRDVPTVLLRRCAATSAIRTAARAVRGLSLSARAFERSLRVGRTIADLAGVDTVRSEHVDEALAYRLAGATP